MNITVIGPGNVGGTLAKRWADRGHHLTIGFLAHRTNEKATVLAQHPNIHLLPMVEAIHQAEVVLIATPAHIALDLIDELGDLTDKIVIDATNSFGKPPKPYPTTFHAFSARTNARVVKAFNMIGHETMADPHFQDISADIFVAGDDASAKAVATRLARDVEFGEVYDFGGNDQVELLEQVALSWVNLAIRQGYGRNIAFKLLKR